MKLAYVYNKAFNSSSISLKEHLIKILGEHLDNQLSFNEHINILLKKAYAKITALGRPKLLVPSNILLVLYKSFVLSHSNSLLIDVNKTLNKKLEDANHYGLRKIVNMGKKF